MTDKTATLNFSDGSPSVSFPDPHRHCRARGHRHPHAVRQDRQVHLRPGLPVDRVAAARPSPTSTATRASSCIAGTRSRSSPRAATSWRPATCCSTASCRLTTQKDEFVSARDPSHDGQRADALLHARLPPRRASDGRADGPRRRVVARSIPTRSTCTTRSSATSRRSA